MTLDNFPTIAVRESTPGPGAYHTEDYNRIGGKYSVHVAVRPKFEETLPYRGNTDYCPQTSTLSRKAQTIGTKPASRPESPRAPGPSYLPNPNEFLSKSVVIKQKYSEPDNRTKPGPADYFLQEPGASSKTKTPPMGARAKIVLSYIPDSPGPAAYDTLGKFGNSTPKYTIRSKTAELRNRNKDPGFEHSNPGKIGNETPRWTIPKAAKVRGYDYANDTPGPGHYDVTHDDNEETGRRTSRLKPAIRPRYSESEKRPVTATAALPNVREFPAKGRGYTIGERLKRDIWYTDPDIPGPEFLPEGTIQVTPIKISERTPDKVPQDTPGPADYNPKDPRLRNPPRYSWKGPGTRDGWVCAETSKVGPGDYNLREDGNDKPKWIIGERSVSRTNRSMSSMREVRSPRAQSAFLRRRPKLS